VRPFAPREDPEERTVKSGLTVVFGGVLAGMLAVTAAASAEQSILDAWHVLWPDWWFRATLADAYFGFLTVYLWVAYREHTWVRRLVWAVAFAALGNIAIATYVLVALRRLPDGASPEALLLRPGRWQEEA
jgi:uncharacterized BrkB/YihY/UPF0761 family membrane protein